MLHYDCSEFEGHIWGSCFQVFESRRYLLAGYFCNSVFDMRDLGRTWFLNCSIVAQRNLRRCPDIWGWSWEVTWYQKCTLFSEINWLWSRCVHYLRTRIDFVQKSTLCSNMDWLGTQGNSIVGNGVTRLALVKKRTVVTKQLGLWSKSIYYLREWIDSYVYIYRESERERLF